MNLNFFFKFISHVKHTIFISAGSLFHTPGAHRAIFQISQFIRIYRTTKVNRSTKNNRCNYKISKNHKKTTGS